jgi:transaldolase
MKLFLDSADGGEIRECVGRGLAQGVTIDASLLGAAATASAREPHALLAEICEVVPGPVVVDVLAVDVEGMLREGRALAALAPNVVIKLPPSTDGLTVVRSLSDQRIATMVTSCLEPMQALLAAKAGAGYVSPPASRADDVAFDTVDLVRKILAVYRTYDCKTEVLVASVRNPSHILDAALAGAQVASVPYLVLQQVAKQPGH